MAELLILTGAPELKSTPALFPKYHTLPSFWAKEVLVKRINIDMNKNLT